MVSLLLWGAFSLFEGASLTHGKTTVSFEWYDAYSSVWAAGPINPVTMLCGLWRRPGWSEELDSHRMNGFMAAEGTGGQPGREDSLEESFPWARTHRGVRAQPSAFNETAPGAVPQPQGNPGSWSGDTHPDKDGALAPLKITMGVCLFKPHLLHSLAG